MALSLRVPTIFSARDGVSSVLRTMTRSVQSFTNRVQTGVGRANRLLNRLTPSIGGAGRQLLSYASAAGVAGAAFGLAGSSAQSIMDYEDQVASFRTIVSDLNDTDFAKYESSMGKVATETKKSTIEVAQAYEKIAGLNSTLADTPEGIAEVSKQAIILSKASRDDLGTSAENLVGIMNQFNLGAKDSGRVINVLAAGQAVGAASITQSVEAYKNFGSVARGANITLEESMGLIQTLAGKMITGTEAGTGLKAVILRLQKAGLGYKTGVFNVNEALEQAKKNYDKLKTAKQKDAYLTDLIGENHINTGRILIDGTETYKKFTDGVTGTSEATKAAGINSNTLKGKIDELKSAWTNYITTSDDSKKSTDNIKEALGWLADNIAPVVKWVTIYFGTLMIVQEFIKLVTAAQWLWNIAMAANPIGLIIIGIAALVALIAGVIYYWDEWGSTVNRFMGPLGIVIDLIMTLKQNWDMIKKAFKEEGIIGGLKAIGRVILDVLLKPIQTVLGLLSNIPGLSNLAAKGIASIQGIRDSLGVDSSEEWERKDKEKRKIGAKVKKEALPSLFAGTTEAIYKNINTQNSLDINVKDRQNILQVVNNGGNKNNIRVTKTKGAR